MQYLARRLLTALILTLMSINASAIVIETGDLSYDSDTQIITGTNGISYLGWDVALGLNYEQTLAATQAGGIYESYHIANQYEAAQFFFQATGIYDAYTTVGISDDAGEGRFGENHFEGELVGPASVAFFAYEYENEITGVGLVISADDSLEYYLDELYVETADEHADGGPYSDSPITWLLVSDSEQVTSVPEPGSFALLSMGLLCLVCARRKSTV